MKIKKKKKKTHKIIRFMSAKSDKKFFVQIKKPTKLPCPMSAKSDT